MIKHHPEHQLLQGFVTGQLPASLSAAIAIHADMCPCCASKIDKMMTLQASESFEQPQISTLDKNLESGLDVTPLPDFDAMIDAIVADEPMTSLPARKKHRIQVGGQEYVLPQAIENMTLGSFTQLGKLFRARLKLEEGQIHSSLMYIQPGGGVPEHTHKGYELTLLLEGEFADEMGQYVPGDFIMLDGSKTHKPASTNGCLCYTVVNEPLHFTQGINRLLNPIGSFIY
jgi:putative transcriptional regulator